MRWLSNILGGGSRPDLRTVWEELHPRVRHLARPAIRLTATPEATSSWLGGTPRVGADFRWPESPERPLAFLAQLDLSALAAAWRVEWLPARGALAFFYDVEAMPWGFDPNDRGRWAVVHLPDASVEALPPGALPTASALPRVHVRASKVDSLPDADSEPVRALELSDLELDAYCDFANGDGTEAPLHQVSGFATPIQSDTMALQCQLVANGIDLGRATAHERPEARALEAGAGDWRLLLQLDSDDDLGVMWGDGGMVYFWIREQDARAGRFDRSWLVLQCL